MFQRTACWPASSPRISTSLAAQKSSSHARCSSTIVAGPSSIARSRVRLQRSASSSAGTPVDVWYVSELDDAQRLAGLHPRRDDGLGEVFADGRLDVVIGRGVDDVAGRARQRHPAVRAPVAEDGAALLGAVQARLEHAVVELAHLARIVGVPEGVHRDVVLVLAVLAVEHLRGHDDRGRAVEHRELEREHGQVAVGQRHEALGADAHPLAGRRPPHQVAGEDAVAEVERPLVGLEVGVRQQQRLVVDVQLHQLGVGDVDDGLAELGEAERVLGVVDAPRLVEAVDVRPVAVGVAALLGVGAHAEVAVADGEQRLGEAEVAASRAPARPAATDRSGSGPGRGARVPRASRRAGPAARRGRRRRRRRRARGGRRGRRRGRRRRRARSGRRARPRRRRRRPRSRRPGPGRRRGGGRRSGTCRAPACPGCARPPRRGRR